MTKPELGNGRQRRKRVTNRQFAADVGITESYASLIRSGKRLPGAQALVTIVTVYAIDANELVTAYRQGPKALARFLDDQLSRVE
jgi:transcriptional regulator with XRE-family HTH domain